MRFVEQGIFSVPLLYLLLTLFCERLFKWSQNLKAREIACNGKYSSYTALISVGILSVSVQKFRMS